MRHLNPYVHSCVEHPTLSCPACKWVEERRTVDVLVCDEGAIWLFNPLSERAKAWVAEHVADILIPYVEALSPAQLERLGELMSRPIVDPPFHGEIADCWDVK